MSNLSTAYELDDGKLLIVGKSATMAAAIERVPVGENEHAVIIDRALLANISLPVGDYGELVERLRDIARRRAETNEPGGSPPKIMSEWLAADALEIQAGALEIQAAELNRATEHHKAQDDAIVSLQGEVERLADALENLLTSHCRLVESGDCGFWDVNKEEEVAAARALLDALPDRAAPSQHQGGKP